MRVFADFRSSADWARFTDPQAGRSSRGQCRAGIHPDRRIDQHRPAITAARRSMPDSGFEQRPPSIAASSPMRTAHKSSALKPRVGQSQTEGDSSGVRHSQRTAAPDTAASFSAPLIPTRRHDVPFISLSSIGRNPLLWIFLFTMHQAGRKPATRVP